MRARPDIDRVLTARYARPKKSGALNLADIDPPVWHVMSQSKAHGPFTLGQLQAFADAGKIGPLTRISSGNGEPFLPALDHPPLRARIETAIEARASRRAEASNFVIITGPDAAPARRQSIAAALSPLGRHAEPLPGTFVLRSGHALSEVRRLLALAAPDGTQLVIFESRDARLGCAGLSMQDSGALRAVWDAPLDPLAE